MIAQVFTFWNDEIEDAPLVVQLGIESWRRACEKEGIPFHLISSINCADYEENFCPLDKNQLQTLRAHIENEGSYHSWRTYSDALRLCLLAANGGMWADPTTICMKPLTVWTSLSPVNLKFPRYAGSHLSCESWLILANHDQPLMQLWSRHLLQYFIAHPSLKLAQHKQFRKAISADRILNRISSLHPKLGSIWFHPVTSKLLKRTDYFAIYFSFEHVRRKWSPSTPLRHYHLPLDSCMYQELINSDWTDMTGHWALDRILDLPVIKLSWKRIDFQSLEDAPETHILRSIVERSERNLS